MQLKKPDYFIIGSGKAYTVEYFLKKSFEYVGLNYKKYVKINRKLIRPIKNSTLVANTSKARKVFKFKNKTNINKIISIMMENDLKIESNN